LSEGGAAPGLLAGGGSKPGNLSRRFHVSYDTQRHQVEIPVPGSGLGTEIDTMHAFCRGLSENYRTRGIGKKRIETGRDGVRFCFAKPEEADAFHVRFSGERLTVAVARR
jgi:hypothetical protein